MKSKEELLAIVKKGAKYRATNQTSMNRTSSRSHAILKISIQQRWIEENNASTKNIKKKKHERRALLTVVDLAGSERLSRSKSTTIRLEEAKAINKSISALGNCINALIHPKASKHIPYRDSKLTRLLTESISGNSKTTLVACVSPSSIQYEETFSTLQFASCASSVSTYSAINEEIFSIKQNRSFQIQATTDLSPSLKKRKRNIMKSTNSEESSESPQMMGRPKSALLLKGGSRGRSQIMSEIYFQKNGIEYLEENKANRIAKKLNKCIQFLQNELAKKVCYFFIGNFRILRLKD